MKATMNSEQMPTVDDTIINMAYAYITGAEYLMEVMTKSVKQYCLEQTISKEQKQALKEDLGFTSQSVHYLIEAGKSFKLMMHYLDKVEAGMNTHLTNPNLYDWGLANMMDLVSVNLVYMTLTNGSAERETKIHNYLKKFTWTEELKEAYKLARLGSERLRRNK